MRATVVLLSDDEMKRVMPGLGNHSSRQMANAPLRLFQTEGPGVAGPKPDPPQAPTPPPFRSRSG